jgi:hypothetical protein
VTAEFLGRPISLAIIAFILLGLLWPWWVKRRQARPGASAGAANE